jgi:hypothetical protein
MQPHDWEVCQCGDRFNVFGIRARGRSLVQAMDQTPLEPCRLQPFTMSKRASEEAQDDQPAAKLQTADAAEQVASRETKAAAASTILITVRELTGRQHIFEVRNPRNWNPSDCCMGLESVVTTRQSGAHQESDTGLPLEPSQ